MKLRMAKLTDSAEILDIYKPYILSTTVTFEYDVPTVADFTERVKNISSKYPYVVCEDDGRLLGYCYGTRFMQRAAFGLDAELSVYLKESARGRGIGTALYGAVIEILEEMNIRNMYGLIAYPNEASVKLHEEYGFNMAGVLKKTGYKFGRWIDLMYFERHIGDDKNVSGLKYIDEIDGKTIAHILTKYSKNLNFSD